MKFFLLLVFAALCAEGAKEERWRLSLFFPREVVRSCYFATVQSLLQYGTELWGRAAEWKRAAEWERACQLTVQVIRDSCVPNGEGGGVCKNVNNCATVSEDLANNRTPTLCFWQGNTAIVCCREGSIASTSHRPVPTTTRSPVRTTTEARAPVNTDETDHCEPIAAQFASPSTGQKAWDKCLEYQRKYVFPCEKGLTSNNYSRVNHCRHELVKSKVEKQIIAGAAAEWLEFPHMVLLGYRNTLNIFNEIKYECGGALISDNFVLTAAHCLVDKSHIKVSLAVVGILRRSEMLESNRYGIKRVIAHENYQAGSKYHDIALLELDKVVPLDQTTVPACLHTGEPVDDNEAQATGWGTTKYNDGSSISDILQKVTLTKFTTEDCSRTFHSEEVSSRKSTEYDEELQICYGDKTKSKDTCEGDSGGPIQVKNTKIACMYTVIGVTSFGQACGFKGVPAIYTRVAHYLPWIESIVWPN